MSPCYPFRCGFKYQKFSETGTDCSGNINDIGVSLVGYNEGVTDDYITNYVL